jgi:hypothetical protein
MEDGDSQGRGAPAAELYERQKGLLSFPGELNTCLTREGEISTLLLPLLYRGGILARAGKVGVLFISQ